ncbi:hypothetical protein CROQUDRAFT_668257 [Cronartium quercuum f. sp. fusiforme G11]|uniref:GmrSD restriction endonucleases N-terminal domain-containing protein n=1 Tax=Cronartium quercuum f. sp. fusiforme G11 TaxID=708437 RepID=A0A9P6NRJ5_9BASI|nr:hypothetical protein CROQUDRAFT_668257 [Cronartium quercuum f. sp. fusiforme G11]
MPPRRRLPSEDPSESYDEGEDDGSGDFVDELMADEIPGEIESANCRVMSTRELFQRMNDHTIDVEPPYQRAVVWARAAQSSLIDSIFKNKWVPTLLFSERVQAVGIADKDGQTQSRRKRIWVCMDGKQRLTSIKLFLTGKIPWIRQPGKQWYFKQSNPPSPSRLIISEELQEIFLSRGITTALYQKLTEVEERDIFRLVQEGKPLTIGEKMQAAAGAWGEYFEELTQRYMVRDATHPNGWCGRITKMTRGADFKTITSMVLLIRDMIDHPNKAPGLITSMQLQKELIALQAVPVPYKLKKEVLLLLDMFMDISLLAPPNTQYTNELNTPEAIFAPIKQGRKSMISPVEMIWIPYLISRHGRQLSIGRLLELIELFKVDSKSSSHIPLHLLHNLFVFYRFHSSHRPVRIRYPSEVKNNKDVTRYIIEWVRDVDVRRLKGKYSGFRVPRAPEPPKASSTASSTTTAQTQAGPRHANGGYVPSSPRSNTQVSKRKNTAPNDSDSSSVSNVKRPRPSAPFPSTNVAQSNTPQLSRLDSSINVNSAPPTSTNSGASTGPRPTASGCQGSHQANGLERGHADPVGSLFGSTRASQMSSFGGSSASQFGQPSNFAARSGSMGASFGVLRQTQPNRNSDQQRPRSSYATTQPI